MLEIKKGTKSDREILGELEAILIGKWITDLANASAFLMAEIPRLNWIGFYFLEGNKLILGPVQGKPACTEIALTRGVCGRAATTKKMMVVDDVHRFADHIVCDPLSMSEMVIPLIWGDDLVGVLDADSPELSRFDEKTQALLTEATQIILKAQKTSLKFS